MANEPTVRVMVDIPMSLLEKVEKYAEKMAIKRSVAVRSILKQFLYGGTDDNATEI